MRIIILPILILIPLTIREQSGNGCFHGTLKLFAVTVYNFILAWKIIVPLDWKEDAMKIDYFVIMKIILVFDPPSFLKTKSGLKGILKKNLPDQIQIWTYIIYLCIYYFTIREPVVQKFKSYKFTIYNPDPV